MNETDGYFKVKNYSELKSSPNIFFSLLEFSDQSYQKIMLVFIFLSIWINQPCFCLQICFIKYKQHLVSFASFEKTALRIYESQRIWLFEKSFVSNLSVISPCLEFYLKFLFDTKYTFLFWSFQNKFWGFKFLKIFSHFLLFFFYLQIIVFQT